MLSLNVTHSQLSCDRTPWPKDYAGCWPFPLFLIFVTSSPPYLISFTLAYLHCISSFYPCMSPVSPIPNYLWALFSSIFTGRNFLSSIVGGVVGSIFPCFSFFPPFFLLRPFFITQHNILCFWLPPVCRTNPSPLCLSNFPTLL